MPGMGCCIASCKSNAIKAKKMGEKVTFFTFPRNEQTRREWMKRCGIKDNLSTINKRVCNKHFVLEDYEDRIRAQLMNIPPRRLKQTAVPSLNLALPPFEEQIFTHSQPQINHVRKKRQNGTVEEIIVFVDSDSSVFENENLENDIESDYEILKDKYNALLQENEQLKRLLRKNKIVF